MRISDEDQRRLEALEKPLTAAMANEDKAAKKAASVSKGIRRNKEKQFLILKGNQVSEGDMDQISLEDENQNLRVEYEYIDKQVKSAEKITADAQSKYSELSFEIQFKGSDESFQKSLETFAKVGAGAAAPALFWSLYAAERIWPIRILAASSYLFSLGFLFIGLFVTASVARQVRKGNLNKKPITARRRNEIDFTRKAAVTMQWLSLLGAWVWIILAANE